MFVTVPTLKRVLRTVVIGAAVLSMVACTAVYRNHGYTPSSDELAGLVVGRDTRASVTEAIGAPSSAGVLNDSGFYYVSSRVRHYGASKPKVVSRELVAISFDQRGVMRNIERFGLERGRVVPLERRVTSSGVADKTFLRQLLGNLGRFNPSSVLD